MTGRWAKAPLKRFRTNPGGKTINVVYDKHHCCLGFHPLSENGRMAFTLKPVTCGEKKGCDVSEMMSPDVLCPHKYDATCHFGMAQFPSATQKSGKDLQTRLFLGPCAELCLHHSRRPKICPACAHHLVILHSALPCKPFTKLYLP